MAIKWFDRNSRTSNDLSLTIRFEHNAVLDCGWFHFSCHSFHLLHTFVSYHMNIFWIPSFASRSRTSTLLSARDVFFPISHFLPLFPLSIFPEQVKTINTRTHSNNNNNSKELTMEWKEQRLNGENNIKYLLCAAFHVCMRQRQRQRMKASAFKPYSRNVSYNFFSLLLLLVFFLHFLPSSYK